MRSKSDWLDPVMPALYIAGGIAVIVIQRNVLAFFSGGLLIAAALAILFLRRRGNRREQEAMNSRLTSIIAPPSRLASTTEIVRAIAPPKLGHADIDRQHRSLASRAATLRVAYAHNDGVADLELMVHELIDALEQHLQAETEAMQRLGVVRDPEIVSQDQARLDTSARDVESYRIGQLGMEELIDRTAGALVAGHLSSPHPQLPSMEDALRQLREGS